MALPDERFEICYLIDADARARIQPALRLRLLPCPLAGTGGAQRVQSLYFGQAPGPGAEPRRRLRIRLHEADGRALRAVVEVKHRVGLRSTVHHAAVPLTDAQLLAAATPVPVHAGARGVLHEAHAMVADGLRPSVLVGHERLALVGDDGEEDLRVTLDSAVAYRRRDLRLRPWEPSFEGDVLAPGESLLVIKVARSVPSWLTLLLGRSGTTRRVQGKQALAMSAADGAADPGPVRVEI